MKRALFVLPLLLAGLCLFAQDDLTEGEDLGGSELNDSAAVTVDVGTSQTARYTVVSELGQEDSDGLGKTLEAYFDLYTSYFHFDPDSLKARLQVRAFAGKDAFDAYLNQVIGQTKDDFVYLHYNSPEKCELLIYPKEDAEDYQLSLAHQAFVQYLKAFAPAAPLWLREGFAVYFETSRLNAESGKADFAENLSWLETIKGYVNEGGLLPIDKFLALPADQAKENIQVFYPQSWAFISFLLQSPDKDSNRYLWDSLAKVLAGGTPEDVQANLVALAEKWPGLSRLQESFSSYLAAKKTFAEMVNDGIKLYNDKKYPEAEAELKKAVAQDSSSHVPYYYLGLVSYYKKDYAMAEFYYKQALSLGCEPGIGNYALGVNAFVTGRSEDAKAFLALAKDASPDIYGPKADEVLSRIK